MGKRKPVLFMGKENNSQLNMIENLGTHPFSYGSTIFNKAKIIENLDSIQKLDSLHLLKNKIADLKDTVSSPKKDKDGLLNIDSNGDTITVRKDVFISELVQILDTHTIERAKYYIGRLLDGVQKVKTNKINEINLSRWKEYDEVLTDSLWVLEKRDTSGAHIGSYWGNFIPQIPNQLMMRYTKKDDWVLDAFVGSGTTLIECKRLGRNGIGIELNKGVAISARELINKEINKYNTVSELCEGDSRKIDLEKILNQYSKQKFQLVILHPPYHDIIKFSTDTRDLSNSKSTKEFLKMFSEVIDNVTPHLEKGRYLALVIGDKYSKGEWIPLGFYCMNEILNRGYFLKSIIVKNFEETRGKRNQKELWRYRALVGGFYIFKHEYIFLFKK